MISKIKLHDIRLYIIVHGILLFLIRPYLTLINGENSITGPIIKDFYILSILVGVMAFATMVILLFKSKDNGLKDTFLINVTKVSILRFSLVFLFWLAIYFFLNRSRLQLGLITLLLEPSVDFIHSNSTFLSNSITGFYPFFIISVFAIDAPTWLRNIIFTFLIIFAIPIGIISGSKSLIINPLFLILLRFSAIKDGISIIYVVIFLLIGLPIFASLEILRHEGIAGLFTNILSSNDFFDLKNILQVATNRFYGTDILYSIIKQHEFSAFPFLYGGSLLGLFFFFIPRFIWDDKPIISFGKIVSEEYLGSEFWDSGISAAPTWIGELFANFSFFALPVYMVCLYFIIRHIVGCYSVKASMWKRIYYFPIAFTTLSFFQEASIAGWILQLLTFAFLCLFFSTLIHGFKNSVRSEN